MNAWQPIESAPVRPFNKDDWFLRHSDEMLLWVGFVVVGHYAFTQHGKGRWKSGGFNREPTHWMPLPEPPRKDLPDER